MHRSVLYWLRAAYRANPPAIVADEMPASVLRRVVRGLSRRWTKKFAELAEKAGPEFVGKNAKLSERQMKAKWEAAGLTVELRLTEGVKDVLRAAVTENVALIRSIPSRYFQEIEGLVMRSVQTGRDLEYLTNELESRYKVTRDRAALIARDQNNKASAVITRARQLDLGVTEAIWLHSTAGKHPRPTHVKMNGRKFDIRQGMWDPAENRYVLPGELINCRCSCRAIIPGFS